MVRAFQSFSILLTVLVSTGLQAQEKTPSQSKWSIALQGGAAYVSPTFTWRDEMMSTFVYPAGNVEVGYQTTKEDSPYAALYGFPKFGIGLGFDGLSALRYNGPSRLKSIINLYGFVERNLLRSKRVSLDFVFDLGAGYNRSLYDPVNNPLNRNFGSHFLVFVGGGFSFHVALTERLEAGVAAQFNHYSTGRLAYPNAGLNNPAAYLSMRYRSAAASKQRHPAKAFENPSRFFYEIYAGGGLHRCAIEWTASGTTYPWPIYSFGGSANYRYRPHLSTGLAVDLYYASSAFLDRLQESERHVYGDETVDAYGPYNPLSGGIGLIQHLHYGNFSAFATLGAYLYRHNGVKDQQGKLYQRVGLKYVLPGWSGLFVAADCKAHKFSHAAMMELTVGVRFGSK